MVCYCLETDGDGEKTKTRGESSLPTVIAAFRNSRLLAQGRVLLARLTL
jgi:hypothetical protein